MVPLRFVTGDGPILQHRIEIGFVMKEKLLLGVDVGSTKIAVVLWSRVGVRLGSARWETLPALEANLERIRSEARRLLEAQAGPLGAIGISGGGPVDPRRGVILTIPNLRGWENVEIARRLSEELGAPARLENDANACALAEWRYGAGRGVGDLAFLTFSTGIGAGLILDGRLYRGHRFLAGEVGHQTIVPGGEPCGCGRRGCLEAYASGAGIASRLAALRAADPSLPGTARELTERARDGDRFSAAFLKETARYLARGLASLIFLINPARIILGTIAVGAGDLVLEPLREELRELVWPSLLEGLEVVPAALGPELGDQAARAVAEETLCPGS